MAEGINLKFCIGLMVGHTKQKITKWPEGAWPRSRDLLFKFWDPLISQEQLKIKTPNFARRLTVRDTKQKKCKNGKKGAWPGSCDLLFKFWDPVISLKRVKVKT